MRNYRLAVTLLSGLGLATLSTPALAGGCGSFNTSAKSCSPSVIVSKSQPRFDPMKVNIRQPMGHLRSVQYSRSPNVSITRIHSMAPSASLADTPNGFTGGCHPQSTGYCRSQSVQAPPRMMAPMPVIDNRTPRQYGDASFVPGIAHVPTSHVDRSVENNQAALNSGRAVAQSTVRGGMAPGRLNPSYVQSDNTQSMSSNYMGHTPYQGPQMQNMGASNGTYWEQTSGPTMIDGMMATKVMCKRAMPQRPMPAPMVRTQVIHPVIGVPVPYPVPMRGPVHCANMAPPMMAGGMGHGMSGQQRWTY